MDLWAPLWCCRSCPINAEIVSRIKKAWTLTAHCILKQWKLSCCKTLKTGPNFWFGHALRSGGLTAHKKVLDLILYPYRRQEQKRLPAIKVLEIPPWRPGHFCRRLPCSRPIGLRALCSRLLKRKLSPDSSGGNCFVVEKFLGGGYRTEQPWK